MFTYLFKAEVNHWMFQFTSDKWLRKHHPYQNSDPKDSRFPFILNCACFADSAFVEFLTYQRFSKTLTLL